MMDKIKDFWLLIFRILAGAFLLTHGTPKINKLLEGGDIKFADPLGLGEEVSLVLMVIAEFFCSILVIIGFKTRWASAIIIIGMLVAALFAHAGDPFSNREKSLLFALVFTTIAVFGAGRYSLDRALRS